MDDGTKNHVDPITYGYSMVIFVAAFALNFVAVNVQEKELTPDSRENEFDRRPLPDLANVLLPDKSSPAINKFVSLILPMFVYVAMFAAGDYRYNRMTVQVAIVIAVKALAIMGTAMPPPRADCKSVSYGSFLLGGCRDMNISINMATAALASLHLWATGNRKLSVLIAAGMPYALLVSRHHYTSDVILGATIGTLVYYGVPLNKYGRH